MKRTEDRGEPDKEPRCEHGHVGWCTWCEQKAEPMCRHGKVWLCGFCMGEDGNGMVRR